MAGPKRREIPPALARGVERFESWRRSRARGARIPERLWKLAVQLAQVHDLSRAATELKLDYYALKRRIDEMSDPEESVVPLFVELAAPASPTMGNVSSSL